MPRSAPHTKTTLPLRLVFAQNIRSVRIHAGMSQERLAAEAGLDRTFIGSLERGLRNISVDNIELISTALALPAHELLDPDLPDRRGLDITLTRAPRTTRPYTPARKSKGRA